MANRIGDGNMKFYLTEMSDVNYGGYNKRFDDFMIVAQDVSLEDSETRRRRTVSVEVVIRDLESVEKAINTLNCVKQNMIKRIMHG